MTEPEPVAPGSGQVLATDVDVPGPAGRDAAGSGGVGWSPGASTGAAS